MRAGLQKCDDAWAGVEIVLYMILLGAGAVATTLRWITLGTATALAVFMLLALVFLAWKRLDGGRHPCFLFLGMLLIFQGGRLIGYLGGILEDPFRMELQTAIPFDTSTFAAEVTLLLIVLSAICVYAPCRLQFRPVQLCLGSEQKWLAAAYVLLLLTAPFAVYKNYLYFDYIRSHGGYLAIYTDNAALVQSAGTFLRAVSLAAYNVFLLTFIMERRSRHLAFVTFTFVTLSLMDLMIGLRGKFFLLVITLWFLYNLKTGKRFRLPAIAALCLGLTVVGTVVASFRENQTLEMITPLGFVSGQGISMQVTQGAIAFRDTLQSHASNYLFNDLKTGFLASPSLGPGQLLDNDLSILLNPAAFGQGFATGSSYLAQCYLFAGVFGVAIASVAIGLVLRMLHCIGRSCAGATLVAILLPPVIYLPRSGLLTPLSVGLNSLLSLVLAIPLLILIEFLLHPGKWIGAASAQSRPITKPEEI